MKNIIYSIAGGNTPLLKVQASSPVVLFQLWYTGIVASDISVEVWISTTRDTTKLMSKVDSATKILPASANGTAVISISGLSYAYAELRLVATAGEAGMITYVDALGGVIQ